ncbi:Endogenous retrovirus group 3 member 1 Env polyprotein [Plecturocebus cupreus]
MLGIDGKGLDPGVSIQIQGKIQKCSAQPVYQPFYNIFNKLVPKLPKKTKNLFLQLAEMIQTNSFWVLKVSIIGQYCLAEEGTVFTVLVGKRSCFGQRQYNRTDAWNHPEYCRDWTALPGLYWICGHRAHVQLPERWIGSCVIGIIKPSFFLLSAKTGRLLKHPVYSTREKRSLKISKWENNKWPLERIIESYGPTSGAWGHRTPIYRLNQIIRLQAALEILVNETGKALSILAEQETLMRNVIYQNWLAIDYLLAA